MNFTRRSFIQMSAVGLAGSSTLANSGLSSSSRRKMTIDLVCGAIGVQADQKRAIELAAKYDFESVQPNAIQIFSMGDSEIKNTLELLKSSGLRWGAAGLPIDFRKDEQKFKDDFANLTKGVSALQKAKVDRMGTWIMPSHDSLTYVQNLKQHSARLGEVGRVLGDYGIRLGLEYVGPKTSWTARRYPFVHTMAETKDLLQEIRMENVGLVLDSWHWYTAGESTNDLMSLKNDDIVAVDLNDAPAGISVDRQMDLKRKLPMATGVIDLRSFLTALVNIGYDGPVRAEPFDAKLREMDPDQAVQKTSDAMHRAFALID